MEFQFVCSSVQNIAVLCHSLHPPGAMDLEFYALQSNIRALHCIALEHQSSVNQGGTPDTKLHKADMVTQLLLFVMNIILILRRL